MISSTRRPLQPPGPDQVVRYGSMLLSAVIISPHPPIDINATIGKVTRPRNMSVPWKMSDQTTATKPPETM